MECGATVHTGGLPDGGRRRTASILAGIAAGLLCGLAQAQEAKTLRWTPPTERADGTALSADELAAHRVLCDPGVDVSVPMPATSWAGVEPGIESCVVRAVDQDGLESADSARVFPAWDPDPDPEPDPPGAPTDVRVVVNELPPSTGPPGGDLMLYINWQGTKDGSNNYTLASPEAPIGTTLGLGSLTVGALSSYGDIRALERASSSYTEAVLNPVPAAGVVDYTGYSILLFIDPKTFNSGDASNPQFFELRSSTAGGGDGGLSIGRLLASSGNLQCHVGWGGWNSEAAFDFAWPAAAFWLWIRVDPDNATSSERLKYKTWAWDGSVPGSWTSGSASGAAATSGTYSDLSYLRFMHRDSSTQPIGFGPVVISTDPDEDMTAFLPSSGSTVEAGLATGAEAGAGFNARVVSRADISEATSAGSTHGASSTIRAAITEGATAQQVASGVASMAAQLAESTLAGAEVTARATLAASITEGAGAGEAVSRQGAVLDQMVAAAEADALLSAYLHAVAALAAGLEAGDAWAARLTAAATFSGAAEASGTFSEDSVALIAAESEAGAHFAAAVHALAEQLEEATAGATMAGIVSTLAAFSSASSAGAVFESAMRHADALQAGAEAGAAFSGITGELTGHLLSAVSAGMVVSSAHQARAAWTSTALAGASFVASGDVSALIGALAFVVAAEQRVFTVPAETRTFIVS